MYEAGITKIYLDNMSEKGLFIKFLLIGGTSAY